MEKQVLTRNSFFCMRSELAVSALAGFGAGGLGGPGMMVNPGLGTDAKSRKYGK